MKVHKGIIFFLVFIFVLAGMQAQLLAAPEVGNTAPQFELSDLNGKGVRLTDMQDPLVAVCFFAPFSKAS